MKDCKVIWRNLNNIDNIDDINNYINNELYNLQQNSYSFLDKILFIMYILLSLLSFHYSKKLFVLQLFIIIVSFINIDIFVIIYIKIKALLSRDVKVVKKDNIKTYIIVDDVNNNYSLSSGLNALIVLKKFNKDNHLDSFIYYHEYKHISSNDSIKVHNKWKMILFFKNLMTLNLIFYILLRGILNDYFLILFIYNALVLLYVYFFIKGDNLSKIKLLIELRADNYGFYKTDFKSIDDLIVFWINNMFKILDVEEWSNFDKIDFNNEEFVKAISYIKSMVENTGELTITIYYIRLIYWIKLYGINLSEYELNL